MRLASLAAAATITALTGCTAASTSRPITARPTPSSPYEIVIYEYTFKPETLTVAVGTTVTWVNRDVAPHTATHRSFGDEPFDSDHMTTNVVFAHKFKIPGRYDYLCIYHQGMRGTIVVQ